MMDFEVDGYDALRRALARMCDALTREDVPDDAVFNCRLVANELLVNALEYGGGSASFGVRRDGDLLRISVRSVVRFRPPETSCCSDVTSERGRGLFLVDALSESRAYSDEEGICVLVKLI